MELLFLLSFEMKSNCHKYHSNAFTLTMLCHPKYEVHVHFAYGIELYDSFVRQTFDVGFVYSHCVSVAGKKMWQCVLFSLVQMLPFKPKMAVQHLIWHL